MAETIHVTTEEDMAVYDTLPVALKKYLDQAPVGLDATTVNELYQQKLDGCTPLYTPYEVQEMVMKVLDEYQKMNGVKDFRKLIAKPGARKHRERPVKVPNRLFKEVLK